jgi:hypothetical protein
MHCLYSVYCSLCLYLYSFVLNSDQAEQILSYPLHPIFNIFIQVIGLSCIDTRSQELHISEFKMFVFHDADRDWMNHKDSQQPQEYQRRDFLHILKFKTIFVNHQKKTK